MRIAAISGLLAVLPTGYQEIVINKATKAPDESTKEKWLGRTSFLRNWNFFYSEILYGRTAAMIQRTKEAMQFMQMDPAEPGVVLNGEAHAANVTSFLASEEYRLKMMDTSFKNMTLFCREIAQDYHMNEEILRRALFDHFVPVQIYKVTDPAQAPSYPARASVGESIQLIDQFNSPSTQQIAEKYLG